MSSDSNEESKSAKKVESVGLVAAPTTSQEDGNETENEWVTVTSKGTKGKSKVKGTTVDGNSDNNSKNGADQAAAANLEGLDKDNKPSNTSLRPPQATERLTNSRRPYRLVEQPSSSVEEGSFNRAFPTLNSSNTSAKSTGWGWANIKAAVPPPVLPSRPEVAKNQTTSASATSMVKSCSNRAGLNNEASSSSIGRVNAGQGGRVKQKTDRKKRPNPNLIMNQLNQCDVVKSRPTTKTGEEKTKMGTHGEPINLTTNYYPLESLTNFNLFQYHVEFKPDEERTEIRKKLLKIHEKTLGPFIFDGQALYTPHRIYKDPMYLYSWNACNKLKTQIKLRLVAEIAPMDTVFLQVYNIMFRNIMMLMGLEPIGRFYYDPQNKITIPSRKLEIWPGFITSVRNHENSILLNLEIVHKVVRSDTVLDFINDTKTSMGSINDGGRVPQQRRGDYTSEVTKNLLGSVVLTRYNNRNYQVDDIKWDATPKDQFKMKSGMSSYMDYYYSKYSINIRDTKQPMLLSLPKKKDYHRGANQSIYLVPELCQMTGLSESMRTDSNLMKEVYNHLVLSPAQRVTISKKFIARMHATSEIRSMLDHWNIKLGEKPVKCVGRVVDMDELIVGGYSSKGTGTKVKQEKPGDWTSLIKSKPMLSTVPLRRWVLISCPKSEQTCELFLTLLKNSAGSMSFTVDKPLIRIVLRDTKPSSYVTAVLQAYQKAQKKVQMFVTILPNNNAEIYKAIKKVCYSDLGVSSQCVLLKTIMMKSAASVASRLAIQMNAKLGGEPWTVGIPIRDFMVVGYDVYHSPNKKSPSVGALVASTSATMAKFFTSTCCHKNRDELSANLCSAMTNALQTYRLVNKGNRPARIILYRDGVGDGQLSYIYNTELPQIKEAISKEYPKDSLPKFSLIVVTKRIHTRFYGPAESHVGGAGVINPPPGTFVDDVITRPERYDFYLVSQAVTNAGSTVSPTSYNVLWDEQGLEPDKIQRFTLKLCHLYFNYTGTIAVPAPCQFAHKLAYLKGMSLSNDTHFALQNLLYFL